MTQSHESDPLHSQGEMFSETVPSFHEQLLDKLHEGVYFVDRERRIQYWNKGAELLTGYSSSELTGKYCFDDILMHVNSAGCALCLDGCPLASTIYDGKSREIEVYLRHKLGHRVPVRIRASPLMNPSGRIIGAAEVFSDSTARRSIERRVGELEGIAFLDSLTGMPNRRYTELKIEQAIQDFHQVGRRAGLLMIDIDHFKNVNDTYGHEIGDEALKATCKTIMPNLRLGDILGRWGGEEFLLLIRDVERETLVAVAEKCRMLIAESAIPVGMKRFRITASLGATLITEEDSAQSAIKRADELMYQSKKTGRNRVTGTANAEL